MDEFEKLLREHSTSRILVVDPEGGKGDQMILLGVEKKLQEFNINYGILEIRKSQFANIAVARAINSLPRLQSLLRTCRAQARAEIRFMELTRLLSTSTLSTPSASEDVILLRGGAYLNDVWKGYAVLDVVSKLVRNNPRAIIIIAPHSFFFDKTKFPEILTQIGHEIHVFCREVPSYDLISSLHYPSNVHIHLSPDTAFYMSESDFPSRNKRDNHVLVAPRLDRESVVTWRVNEMRRFFHTPFICKDINLLPSFRVFTDTVASASEVYTDRLHVAILSAILDKDTYLFPNCYHKNRAIFEFSLQRFSNAQFIDSHQFPCRLWEKSK